MAGVDFRTYYVLRSSEQSSFQRWICTTYKVHNYYMYLKWPQYRGCVASCIQGSSAGGVIDSLTLSSGRSARGAAWGWSSCSRWGSPPHCCPGGCHGCSRSPHSRGLAAGGLASPPAKHQQCHPPHPQAILEPGIDTHR